MKNIRRQLVLSKGNEKFIFRYAPGCEDELLEHMIREAKSNKTNFDWFDAAVLSFRLTQSLIGEANHLLHQNVET